MLKCNCNELCFYYKKTSITEIDGKKYTQTHDINKCNRLLSDNSKKKPCDFNSKILIDEKVVNLQQDDKEKIKIDCPIVNKDKNHDKILTHRDIRNKINDMFEYYYIKSSNYFGNLNYYLKIIGYHSHDPTIETLSELKTRLSRKPNNVTKIYMDKESYFSHTIGEFDYDYENEEQIFKRIKRGDDPLKWTKNEIVQDILKRKIHIHKKLSKSSKSTRPNKSNKSIKSTNCYKVTLINELLKNNDDEEIEEIEENQENEDKEDKEDDEEDDEEDEKNSENLKDNEFDVEEFSDDDNDYDDNNYEDFSD